MELEQLGAILRQRRESLGWTREDLAGRMPHSAAYIFLIEGARPRRGGHPSRPRRTTLIDWARALRMDEAEINRALSLAGYPALDVVTERRYIERGETSTEQERNRLVGQLHEILNLARDAHEWDEVTEELRGMLDGITHRLTREIEARERGERDLVLDRVHDVLGAARRSNRWDGTVASLNRFLDDMDDQLHDNVENMEPVRYSGTE